MGRGAASDPSNGQRRHIPQPASAVLATESPDSSSPKSAAASWQHQSYDPRRLLSGSSSPSANAQASLRSFPSPPTATAAYVEENPFVTEDMSPLRGKKHFVGHRPQELADLVGNGITTTTSTMGFAHTSRRHFQYATSNDEADQLTKVHSLQQKLLQSKDILGDRSRLINLAPMLRVRLKNVLTKGQLGHSWEGELEYCSIPELCRLFLHVGVELTVEEASYAAAVTSSQDQQQGLGGISPSTAHLGRIILFFADLLPN